MPAVVITALRLLAIEALAPTAQYVAAEPVWPTLCAGRYYDSGAVPFDRSHRGGPEIGAIHCSVYADEARGAARGEARGWEPQDLTVDLVFDFEIPTIENGEVGVGLADAVGVAMLEAASGQVRRLLSRGPSAIGFRRLAKGFGGVIGRWSREPNLGLRLARLTMTIPCHVDDDDWSDVVGGLPTPVHAVADRLPPGSYGRSVLDRIAALWTAPADPTPLEEIRFGFAPGSVPSDLAAAPIVGRSPLGDTPADPTAAAIAAEAPDPILPDPALGAGRV